MTSEAPHRPGQEPGEVSPGAGGPAPYGDRPAQQDNNGYPGAADLGWAPPPPAGSPAQPAPAWANPDDQRPGWAQQGGQPAAGRASAQVPPPGQPDAWGAAPQPGWAAAPEQAGPAWGAPEQGTPAWAAAPPPSGEQGPPGWAAAPSNAAGESAPPAWGTVAGHGEQPAWAQPGESATRGAAQVPAPATTPHESWAVPAGQQPDDPNRSAGWGGPQQDGQPSWGQQGETPAPAWTPAEPAARAAAKVSVPGAPPDSGWPGQDDPDRSGGWAAGRAAGQAEASQPPVWGAPDEQRPAWSDSPHHRDQDRPADDPAQGGRGSAAVPMPGDRPESGGWAARASVSAPAPDSPSWGDTQDSQAQWTPERAAIPEAEPWAPGEAWGRPAEAAPDESPSNGWQPARAEEPPTYQPAPGPGISPANAVPLPQQEQRVPGAALAASPPADYAPPAQFAPADEPAQPGWGTPDAEPDGPVVPGPRTSPESGAAGAVSASASVPMASRVTPPTDQPLHSSGVSAPQPRVYGRPARPEPEDTPGQDGPNGFAEPGPRFDGPAPQPRFDEPDRSAASNAFADGPPAPSSPAGPPPFPPGVPSFVDPASSNRPVNGVHPASDERPGDPFAGPDGRPDPFAAPGGQPNPFGGPDGHPDPFGGPGGHPDPFGGPGGHPDPFGGPGGRQDAFGGPGAQPDPFGGPGGHPDPFGGPGGHQDAFGGPGAGRAPGAGPGPGGFPPAFPPPPQPAPPAWSQGQAGDPDQGRFDAFKPEPAPQQTEAPTPKVRNGRVLAVVLIAAVLILAIPLGLLVLLGKIGGNDDNTKPAGFDPAVGSCVKQSGGDGVAAADCGEQGAFTVVSKVDAQEKCGDPAQPHVVLQGGGTNRVLCLKPAGK
ncbi:hypothetical protein ABZ570_19545 [Micromonospora sp. NPDC007271]|uniref:LppU/SCO3897 family protein n=1 Tax=Micromonospora sp. NPDC007271 TaxID=3154587 RepID=UPI00340B92E3